MAVRCVHFDKNSPTFGDEFRSYTSVKLTDQGDFSIFAGEIPPIEGDARIIAFQPNAPQTKTYRAVQDVNFHPGEKVTVEGELSLDGYIIGLLLGFDADDRVGKEADHYVFFKGESSGTTAAFREHAVTE